MKIFIFLLTVFSLSGGAAAQDFSAPLQAKASPVVVELFSSQNCPACPPADEFMRSLAQSDGVIALSCHVNYFGRTTGNFGKKFCTDRQTRYIRQIKRKSHYTPQMMINGHMDAIGYETEKVTAHIVKGRSERVSDIAITPKGAGVYDFSLPARTDIAEADLWLAVYQKPQTVQEHGRPMTYYNVVSAIMPLGDWVGTTIQRAVFPVIDDSSAGFAIVAQDKKSGKILAAGDYKL